MAEIVMPRLSDTMEEGTILRWLKSDGDEVKRGDELVEIETDKAAMVYEADQEGVLEIVAGEGSTLAVGETIARVGATTGTPSDGPASGGPARADAADGAATANGAQAAGPSTPVATESAATPAGGAADERIRASPLAKRIAQDSGIDLHGVSGSGPGGRIVKADVLGSSAGATSAPRSGPEAAGAPAAAEAQQATLAGVSTAKGEATTVELSRTQQTIARRMAESKATIPDFALQMDVDMEDCVALRAELKRLSHPDAPSEPGGSSTPVAAPTYNDMVVKAAALALREHPRANSSYRDGKVQLHSRVNVGVAVASEDALVVPTVFDAEEKSLGEISRETRALAERVRSGAITPSELGGGTFTVSNLGMYGVRSFTAIVNPPQAAILSVGSLEARTVVRDGQVVVRHTLTLTLVCDHRILYGADAARFLARVRELLETPSSLTL